RQTAEPPDGERDGRLATQHPDLGQLRQKPIHDERHDQRGDEREQRSLPAVLRAAPRDGDHDLPGGTALGCRDTLGDRLPFPVLCQQRHSAHQPPEAPPPPKLPPPPRQLLSEPPPPLPPP